MRSPTAAAATAHLYDRDEELAQLVGLLAQARAGEGRLVVVEGPGGIGKTAVLRELAGRAREGGILAVTARATPLEFELPFGVVRQLLAPLASDADMSGHAALAGPLLAGEPFEEEQAGAALLHALYWVVASLAERRPLLLVLDDAQWCDPPSSRFLRFLLPRVTELPVLVVVSSRPGETTGGAEEVAALTVDPAVELLVLGPLRERGVRELLAGVVEEVSDELVQAVRDATGGNPFFVRELARELEGRTDALPVARLGDVGPARVARWAIERLRRLPEDALALARAVAVLGGDAEVRLAARLADIPAEQAAVRAAQLVRAAILEDARPLRFSHAIVGSAIYREMPEAERASAHAAAARALAADGAEAERVAAHYLRAERLADPDAVRVLELAAERAESRGAPELAARYLERALAEPAPDRDVGRLLVALAEAQARTGDAADAERRLREALPAIAAGPARAGAVVALARALGVQARFQDATALLEEELARLGRQADPEVRLRLETEAAYQGALVPGGDTGAAARLERYADLAPSSRLHRGALLQLAHHWAVSGRPREDAVTVAARALQPGALFGRDGIDLPSLCSGLTLLVAAEERELVDQVTAVALADVRAHVAPLEYVHVAAASAGAALLWGDLAGAEALARSAVAVAAEHEWRQAVPVAHGRLIQILIHRGALQEAEELLEREGLAAELADNFFGWAFAMPRGALRLAQGRLEEAVEDLRRVYRPPGNMPSGVVMSPAAQLALALMHREPAEARQVAEEAVAAAGRWGKPGFLGRALVTLGVVQRGEEGIATLREGRDLLERSPLVLDTAIARLELGAALRRANLRQDAREHLRNAADLGLRIGALPVAKRAEEELRATGARPRNLLRTGVDALTATERRIATMAAEGLSNPQIAQALFVTRKNVEMHLSKAYAKLDIRSRDELPAALGPAATGETAAGGAG